MRPEPQALTERGRHQLERMNEWMSVNVFPSLYGIFPDIPPDLLAGPLAPLRSSLPALGCELSYILWKKTKARRRHSGRAVRPTFRSPVHWALTPWRDVHSRTAAPAPLGGGSSTSCLFSELLISWPVNFNKQVLASATVGPYHSMCSRCCLSVFVLLKNVD